MLECGKGTTQCVMHEHTSISYLSKKHNIGYHTSNVLGSNRNIDVEKSLNSECIALLVAHHGHVVQAIEERQCLQDHVEEAIPSFLFLHNVLNGKSATCSISWICNIV